MKTKNLVNISNNAHHNYKIPKDLTIELLQDQSFGDLKKVITGSIKSYIDCYGTGKIHIGSLEKRITGGIKEYYGRLLVDRYIVNWLTQNRVDLSEVEGELRNGLINIIKESLEG